MRLARSATLLVSLSLLTREGDRDATRAAGVRAVTRIHSRA